jgi:hypothetical protein
VLDGGYQIEDLLEADSASATFSARVLADSSIHAFVTVVEARGDAADEQVALWESAKQLQHPNLNAPLAAGRTGAGESQFAYVVCRRPEEKLGDSLALRPLSAAEAGDLLESIGQALEYLHSHGFVHGSLSPGEVFALGDSIVLSTVSLRRIGSPPPVEGTLPKYMAPGTGSRNVTPAADIWCLGATLFECLTQKNCEWNCREQARQLPPPFNRLVERCLDPDAETRSKLVELQALYAAAMAASLAETPARALRQASSSVTPEKSRVNPQPATPERDIAQREKPQLATRAPLGEAQFRSARGWIYALAVLVIILVIWFARSRHSGQATQPSKNPEPVAQTRVTVPKGKAAWPTRTIAPDGTTAPSPTTQPQVLNANPSAPAQTPLRPLEQPGRNEPSTVNGPIWRVVLYTYASSKDAENMVHSLNEKHPGLNAGIFSPRGGRGPFLVTAGGGMDLRDALRLRRQLLRMGLPHDTYIQNYRQ